MAVLDYHLHSEYSDGSSMEQMVRAAAEAGLDGVGFADHCNVTSEVIRRDRDYFLHETYRERREELTDLREEYDLRIFDTVEVDYYPHDEARIRMFLEKADFDFTIGSVHYVRDRHVAEVEYFTKQSPAERQRLVDCYFNAVVQLIESELFDIAAHLDIFERYEPFRGLATEEHYSDVVDALEQSRTVPEINVGRLFTSYGPAPYEQTHPKPAFLEYLADHGVAFTFGSDSHSPDVVEEAAAYYRDTLAPSEFSFVTLDV